MPRSLRRHRRSRPRPQQKRRSRCRRCRLPSRPRHLRSSPCRCPQRPRLSSRRLKNSPCRRRHRLWWSRPRQLSSRPRRRRLWSNLPRPLSSRPRRSRLWWNRPRLLRHPRRHGQRRPSHRGRSKCHGRLHPRRFRLPVRRSAVSRSSGRLRRRPSPRSRWLQARPGAPRRRGFRSFRRRRTTVSVPRPRILVRNPRRTCRGRSTCPLGRQSLVRSTLPRRLTSMATTPDLTGETPWPDGSRSMPTIPNRPEITARMATPRSTS
jgi:hypothetical protein